MKLLSYLLVFLSAFAVFFECSDGQTLGIPYYTSSTLSLSVGSPSSYVSIGLSIPVTTTSVSDKVILMATLNWRPSTSTDSLLVNVFRNGAAVAPALQAAEAVRAGEYFPITLVYVDAPGIAGPVSFEIRVQGIGTISQNGNPRTLLAFVVPNTYPATSSVVTGAMAISQATATNLGMAATLTLSASGPVLVASSSTFTPLGVPLSLNYGTYSMNRGTMALANGLSYPSSNVANRKRPIFNLYLDSTAPAGTTTYSATARKGHSGTYTFNAGGTEGRSVTAFALPALSAYVVGTTSSVMASSAAWISAGMSVAIPGTRRASRVLLTVQVYGRSYSAASPTATGHYTIFRNGINLGDATVGLQTFGFVSATPDDENRDASFFVQDFPPNDGATLTYVVMLKASLGMVYSNEFSVVSQLAASILDSAATPAPTVMPTFAITAPPTTARPTSSPTSASYTTFLTSPTYVVSPGFAFAARSTFDGSIWTWGQLTSTSSALATATNMQASGTSLLAGNRAAYAFLKSDGSVGAFGVSGLIAGSTTFTSAYPYKFASIVSNEAAFAGISTTGGKVLAFGSSYNGGDVSTNANCNGYAAQLSSGVVSIVATSAAFAALKSDGTVYAWGNKYAGGGVSSETRTDIVNVRNVYATASAFAALLTSGAVKTWGDKFGGGDSSAVASSLASGVLHIIGSQSVFVAYKQDTSIVVWGNPYYGGAVTSTVVPALSSGVKFVSFTALSLAALKEDGSVVAWGDVNKGGDTSAVSSSLTNIAALYSNRYAFAALTAAGGVVAWGDFENGGLIPSTLASVLSSGVTAIYSTHRAFAALKGATGQLVLWGSAFHGAGAGAAAPYLTSGVRTVCANDAAFTAILQDGRAVAWGHPSSIPIPGLLSGPSFSYFASCATGAARAGI